ncbi:TPA: LysR family transcriptional regulator [Serratia odorifera]|nr:LysR family transcriptional regulator [Serratia odorifera]
MVNIRENDFSRIDLNLLTVLLVLYREGSVSRAAQKLFLGQPAVSGALARLRVMFDDPLFVRSANGMDPTPRAHALVRELTPLMENMQQVLFRQPQFSPASSQHSFRLGITDWVESWLMPPLFELLHQHAPGITLNVVATDPFQDGDALEQDRIDLAISVADGAAQGLRRQVLAVMGYKTFWHPAQWQPRLPLTLEAYTRGEHLLVSYRGANSSIIDRQLALLGHRRRVRYTTPHFATLPLMLQRTPTFATVPDGLEPSWRQHFGLCASELPLEIAKFEVAMLWHRRREQEPALQWLRSSLAQLLAQ